MCKSKSMMSLMSGEFVVSSLGFNPAVKMNVMGGDSISRVKIECLPFTLNTKWMVVIIVIYNALHVPA